MAVGRRAERALLSAGRAIFFFWMRALASDETPRRIVQVETLAAALPVGDVVD